MKKTLLLVEDEVLIAISQQSDLEKYGYKVFNVNSAEKAIETVNQKREDIDLILMDINLGSGIDGTKTAEQILENNDIPIVFLSNHTEPEIVEKTEEISSYGYVVKSTGVSVLNTSINLALRLFDEKQKVKESETKYRNLVENIDEIVFKLDTNGIFTYVNSAAEKIAGYKYEDVVGNPFVNFVHSDDLPVVVKHYEQVISGEQKDSEYRVLKKSGEIFWVSSRSIPIYKDDKIVGLQGVIQDITEKKRTEELIRQNEEWYRNFVNCSPDILYKYSSKYGGLFWSAKTKDILGYDPDEIKNDPLIWNNSIHPDDRPAVQEAIHENEKGKNYSIDYRIQTKQGDWKWLHDCFIRKTILDDEIIIDGHAADITERKQLEQALQKSQQILSSVLNNTKDGVVRFDSNLRHIFANQTVYDATGLSPEEYLGKTNEEIGMPDELSSLWRKKHERVLKSARTEVFEFEFPTVNKGERIFQAVVTPELNENGDVENLVSFMRDITNLKKVEEQITVSLEEKEILLQEIHHRVKNNLSVISSLLSLQARKTKEDSAKAVLLDSQSRVQTISMIHETLYRSDNLSAINMKTYLSELGSIILQGYGKSSNIDIYIEAENCLIGAKQATPLGLIVNELITNTIKYAFPDDKKGEIKLKLTSDMGNDVKLIVSDNGIGFPDGFDVQKSDSLGLTLIKNIAENQLGGTIDIENNEGVRFTMKFTIDRV